MAGSESVAEDVDFEYMWDEDDPSNKNEAAAWLRKKVGVVAARDLPAEPSEFDFKQGLRSGMMLCNCLNKIKPGSVRKIVSAPSPVFNTPDVAAIAAYSINIKNFLTAMEAIGLPTFEPSDLEQGGDFSRVVCTLLSLKAFSETGQTKFAWKSSRSSESAMSRNQSDMSLSDQFGDQSDLEQGGPIYTIVCDLLEDKDEEDIPVIVENIVNKVKEEFDTRLGDDYTPTDESYAEAKKQRDAKREKEEEKRIKREKQLEEERIEKELEQERLRQEQELLELEALARKQEEERAAKERERLELLAQQERERARKEAEERARREEEERLRREEEERLRREEEERLRREEEERLRREEEERLRREEEERLRREEEERLRREEEERLRREEEERLRREEEERLRLEEEERLRREEEERIRQERERIRQERIEAARIRREKILQEKREKKALEKAKKKEEARIAREKARIERDRELYEKREKARLEKERIKKEKEMELQKERERKQQERMQRQKELKELQEKAKQDALAAMELERVTREKELLAEEEKINKEEEEQERAYKEIQEQRALKKQEYKTRMAEYSSLNIDTTKRNELTAQQDGELQGFKTILSTAKTDMQSMQTNCQEEADNLGTHVHTLCSAAAGYTKVLEENRKLYNQVQDLKGNIRVYCRIRPFLPNEKNHVTSVDYTDEETVAIISPKNGKEGRKASVFNKVFGPTATQEEVFSDTRPLIRSVLDGFNVCIFACGQTGSGKTYTLSGPDNITSDTMGVGLRALNDLFATSEERKDHMSYEISINMLEIYNDDIFDLLQDGSNNKLELHSGSKKGINVPDAVLVPVSSTDDVITQMNICKKNRSANDHSNRSHSFLTVHVFGKDLTSGETTRGCMHLCDLAGSEKVDDSDEHVQKSLSGLADILVAIANKAKQVPYKNTKLTHFLQDAIGAQAKILMFVHVHPDLSEAGETLNTFKFVERFSTLEGGPGRSPEFRELKEQICLLKSAMAKKEAGDPHWQELLAAALPEGGDSAEPPKKAAAAAPAKAAAKAAPAKKKGK